MATAAGHRQVQARRWRWCGALAVGAGVLWLAACGSSNLPRATDGPTGTMTADAASDDSAAPEPGFKNPGGMWMPSQLGQHAAQLRQLGLELDPAQLADPIGEPLGAVVYLGGCTASFVSADGLVITNHHCVRRALQYNSVEGENLLRDGFVAADRKAERWIGPTGRVFVTLGIRDVTQTVRAGLEAIADPKQRHDTLEQHTKQVIAQCEARSPGRRCRVASSFGGGQVLLVEQLELRDVRLVYAPPEGVGNFGDEIDNWQWPRHTGDVGIYRAYLGPDGQPADHAAKNVPYHPKRHLRLASRPLGAGDLVFVAGFPARTTRWHTAAEVRDAVEWRYPRTLTFCDDIIGLLERLGKQDPKLAIKGNALLQGLSNWRSNTKGMLEGLVKGGLLQRKGELEADLQTWIKAEPARAKRYGGVIERMAQAHRQYRAQRDHDAALHDAQWLSMLVGAADQIVRMAEERPKPDADRDPQFQKRNWKLLADGQHAKQRVYDRRLDRAKLAQTLLRAARLPEARRPALVSWVVDGKPPTRANIEAALDRMYQQTRLEKVEHRVKLLQTATTKQLRGSRDPFIQLAVKLRPLLQEMEDRQEVYVGATALDRPRYVGALKDKAGGVLAPDANRTLRVTYGTVRGYRPKPGADQYHPFTYLPEMVAKHTGTVPFDVPQRVLQAASGPFGPYVHPDRGQVPVDFLADLDITGGNSGSPTLNSRGELVGLVFDGNYESIASDWLFMPAVTRSIHVDLRYILWLLDKVDGADHLLREMGGTPALD